MNEKRDSPETNRENAQTALEEIVLTRLLRLNSTLTGLVTGLICGLALFIATNWLVIKGGEIVGPHLQLISQFFYGYRVTFLGSLIGFGYAFVVGFLGGYLVAAIYNTLTFKKTNRRGPSQAGHRDASA